MTSPIKWHRDRFCQRLYWGCIGDDILYEVNKSINLSHWRCALANPPLDFDQAETLEEAKRRCEEHLEGVR